MGFVSYLSCFLGIRKTGDTKLRLCGAIYARQGLVLDVWADGKLSKRTDKRSFFDGIDICLGMSVCV